MNKLNSSTTASNFQTHPHHAQTERPFLASLVCAAQLKLLLRRERVSASSCQKRRCLDKLMDGVDAISLSLQGLRRSESCDAELPEFQSLDFAGAGTVSSEATQ